MRRELGLFLHNIDQLIFFLGGGRKRPNTGFKFLKKKKKHTLLKHLSYFRHTSIQGIFILHTLIFFVFGAARPFSGLFFRFLGLVLLTVKVMLVGVCCVAVYNTVEGESSSSQLSVALLSPPEKRFHSSGTNINSLPSMCTSRESLFLL